MKSASDLIAVRAPALPAQSIPGGRLRKGGFAPLRGFFATPDRLGEYVLVDYVRHKRRAAS
jgi:hypothetical protein